MSITKEQQQALDDALVPREQRLTIDNYNYRLSTTFKPKEPTFQVALDVLSLTPFYPDFLITASVPVVYMQEFWATVTYQKHHIKFKMNKKSYSFDLDTFRNMLQMYPKLPGQKFVDPPFEEDILTFMRELGYSGNIKLLSDVKVDMLPQPWRTFGTIINKCLSGKVTGIDTLRLSRAQILWGLYHQKKVDYVYLLWEDLVFQIENKESRKNIYIFIPQYEVVQKYGAILPDNLTTPAMKESEAYKTYHDLATGKVQPKPKYVRRSSRSKTEQAPKPSPGKRVKATAKLATKQSLIQTHTSHARGSGAHEGTGVTPGVPDVPNYGSDEEQLSWKSSDEEDDDDEANFSTHDDEARQDEEVNEEDSFDPRVQTPSHVESIDDEVNDDEIQGANVEGEEMDEEAPNEEEEGNELYRDVKVNLAGQDVEMKDAQQTNVQTTQVIEDTHVIITLVNPKGQQQSSSVSSGFVSNVLNPNPDSGIDSIFYLNTEATSMVDVLVTTIVEPPLLFDHRLKALKDNLSEFMQTKQFVEAISIIPGIVDAYLANKMHKTVKTTVQLQSNRLREEAQAENEDFINKIDDNIKKIIKDQVKQQIKAQVFKILPKIEKTVNEQLEAEVLTCSSKESKTSHAVAANLFELELKKILIDKIESNKSIHRSDEQNNLYKALVDAYESDKLILDTYGDTISFKRCRDDEDKDEEPS
ncbi:hypothetical protein Tco_0496711, partial [Tanacetum coccineum]